jgi:6-phosphogluconate dehydrogenase
MGANMANRIAARGHECVVYDRDADAVARCVADGSGTGAASVADLVKRLDTPRTVWLMIPAAAVDNALDELVVLLSGGDIVVDGGNSHYQDTLPRAARLAGHEVSYVDVGTSGGVWGRDRGYCLMIGGERGAVQHLEPIFAALAPGEDAAPATAGRDPGRSTAHLGYLHCGGPGAGHFVKMVHNGIEYGLMAAYAEGLNLLRHANVGAEEPASDAETSPLRAPEHFRYDIPVAEVAELWRRGSVIGSWLLDLTAAALAADPGLDDFAGAVSDSGEGRWTVQAAIDAGVPVPVLSAALYGRFSSRDRDNYANRVLSAMRYAFGGHLEQPSEDRQ